MRLTPVEGFVLSRVDGQTSYEDICHMSGLRWPATLDILRKLRRERLILNPGEKPEKPDPWQGGRPATGARPRRRLPMGAPAAVSLLEVHDDGIAGGPGRAGQGPGPGRGDQDPHPAPAPAAEDAEAHELLALSPGADPAMVKRAYFAASKELHPDRFYGKDIGPYRDKLSDIFAQLTRAFEQLKK